MLVGMSLPTEFIIPGYHINLSVVTGILIGPALGFLAAFIANLILALMGHGGITVIGLNTLLLGSEAILGHTFFYLLRMVPVFWRAVLATVLTLFVTTLLLIGFVALSHLDPELLHQGEEHGPALAGGSLRTFAFLILSIGAIGWIIEAAITGAVVKFISRVKPDLLGHVLHAGKK
jgi:cobalt/nickel transport system permease protein